eukprot:3606030-Amphidinium_carterae.1
MPKRQAGSFAACMRNDLNSTARPETNLSNASKAAHQSVITQDVQKVDFAHGMKWRTWVVALVQEHAGVASSRSCSCRQLAKRHGSTLKNGGQARMPSWH